MCRLKKTNYNVQAYVKSYTEMRMNVLHKYINIRILFCILTVCFLLCLSGCEESPEGMKIYYRNVTDNTLVAVDFETESTDAYQIINEMFEQMRKKPKQKEIDILLLDGIEIINTEINMNVANIYFNQAYNVLNNIDEVLMRAGVVKAITQIDSIDYVRFFVDGSPARYEDGTFIGLMSPDDFINDSKDAIGNVEWRDITLYFANKTGDKLVKTTESVGYAKNTSIERIVVERLIKGTSDNNLSSTLPSDLKLLSISVSEGVCYVNLSSVFLTEMVNVSNEIPIYSIVNSLCELKTIREVRMLINGDSNRSFRESIQLNTSFQYNKDIVST